MCHCNLCTPYSIIFFMEQKQNRGKLIVFEGGDGSGKTTQTQLLLKYCTDQNISHAYFDFPNYPSFFGQLIAKFLRGELGSIDKVSPYLASLPFSFDRAAMSKTIEKNLGEGRLVILNRYASSNMAHQGSKLENDAERESFLNWVEQLEFEVNKIPREDLVIYLHVPWQQAIELTKKKYERHYLNGKKDIQESNALHQKKTGELYQKFAQSKSNWETISCFENGIILTKEIIHNKIIEILKTRKIL